MKELKEINCVYGSEHQKSILFVYGNWYVCEGSVNVNATYDEISDGVDIELLNDYDMFTASEPINSLEELQKYVDDE